MGAPQCRFSVSPNARTRSRQRVAVTFDAHDAPGTTCTRSRPMDPGLLNGVLRYSVSTEREVCPSSGRAAICVYKLNARLPMYRARSFSAALWHQASDGTDRLSAACETAPQGTRPQLLLVIPPTEIVKAQRSQSSIVYSRQSSRMHRSNRHRSPSPALSDAQFLTHERY